MDQDMLATVIFGTIAVVAMLIAGLFGALWVRLRGNARQEAINRQALSGAWWDHRRK